MKHFFSKIISFAVVTGVLGMVPVLPVPFAIAQITVGEADSVLNQGIQQLQSNQTEAALKSSLTALILYEQLGDHLGVAQALGNIGLCHIYLGNGEQAGEVLQAALALARTLQDPQTEANALANLAQLYFARVEFDAAIEHMQGALEIAESLNNQPQVNQAQQFIENAKTSQEAMLALEAAGEHISQAFADGSGQGLVNLLTQGETSDAAEEIAQAFGSGEEFARALSGDPGQALLQMLEQNGTDDAFSLLNQGSILSARGDYNQAIALLKEYIARPETQEDWLAQMLGRQQISQAYWKANDFQNAEITLTEMMEIGEVWGGWNDSGLQSDHGNIANLNIVRQTMVYEMLQHILAIQNKPGEALEISERGRSRAFINLLTQRAAPSSTTFALAPPTLKDIQEIAKAEEATLVQYSIIEYNGQPDQGLLFIWVIQPSGNLHFEAVNLAELAVPISQLIANSRDAMGARGRGANLQIVDTTAQANHLKQLHELLISPIESFLPDAETANVIFIPQGELFLVPFPALQNADGQYLIENHTVSTSPSLQLLALTSQRQQQLAASSAGRSNETELTAEDFLIIGNPLMPIVSIPAADWSGQLNSLPGTEIEAEAIAALFGTQAITGAAATEKFVKQQMKSSRILHLATHGLLDFDVSEKDSAIALPGALALASGNGEDGLLTSTEIFEMNIAAELVVLSACDTGRGRITGDGVVGLARSFIAAGTPNVLASLWAVPDGPTAELMTEFYRQLGAGQDNAQALRQAMLTTMEQYRSPKNWAAFTLIGTSK